MLVPRVDADGNDAPGIRVPELAAPTGTYLGWNLRKPRYAAGELCLIFGGYVPFAADASRGGDPRVSLAERYARTSRAEQAQAAADTLVQQRFLLDQDR